MPILNTAVFGEDAPYQIVRLFNPFRRLDQKKFIYLGQNIDLADLHRGNINGKDIGNTFETLTEILMEKEKEGVYTLGPAVIKEDGSDKIKPLDYEGPLGIYGYIGHCKFIPKKPITLKKALREVKDINSLEDFANAGDLVLNSLNSTLLNP